jgi:hypothetical protein
VLKSDVVRVQIARASRNIVRNRALPQRAPQQGDRYAISWSEAAMARRQERQREIVETPTEARQAEAGPSVLALLTVSTGLAVLILGVLWFVFFRT